VKVRFTVMKNILDPHTATRGVFEAPGPIDLLQMIQKVCPEFSGLKLKVAVNSHPVVGLDSFVLEDGDFVLITPSIDEAGVIIGVIGAIIAVLSIGWSIYQYSTLSNQLNSLKNQVDPHLSDSSGTLSQAFGFNIRENLTYDGNPIPVLYGIQRLGGTIINQFLYCPALGERERVKLCLGLCEGPVEAVAPGGADDVFLDDSQLSSFADFDYEGRVGSDAEFLTAPTICRRVYQQKYFGDSLIHYNTWHLVRSSGTVINVAKPIAGLYPENQKNRYQVSGQSGISYFASGGIDWVSMYYDSSYARFNETSDPSETTISNLVDPYTEPFTVSFYMMRNDDLTGIPDGGSAARVVFRSQPDLDGPPLWGMWEESLVKQPEDSAYNFASQRSWGVFLYRIGSSVRIALIVVKCNGNRYDGYVDSQNLCIKSNSFPITDLTGVDGKGPFFAFVREGDILKVFKDGKDITDANSSFSLDDSSVHAQNVLISATGKPHNFHTTFAIGGQVGIFNHPYWYGSHAAHVAVGNLKIHIGKAKWIREFTPPSVAEMVAIEDHEAHSYDWEGISHGLIIQYRFPHGLYGYDWGGNPVRSGTLIQTGAYPSSPNPSPILPFPYHSFVVPTSSPAPFPANVMSGRSTGLVNRSVEIPFMYVTVTNIGYKFYLGDAVYRNGYPNDRATLLASALWNGVSYLFIGVDENQSIPNWPAGSIIKQDALGAVGTVTSAGVQQGTYPGRLGCAVCSPTWSGQKNTNKVNLHTVARYMDLRLRYPQTATISVELRAGDRMADIPKINAIVKRVDPDASKPLYRWTGSAYSTISGSAKFQNPAWIVWDMLTNGWDKSGVRQGNYGAGIDPKYLDYTSFSQWAGYCYTLLPTGTNYYTRCTCNIVFDMKDKTLWDCLEMVCILGRGRLKLSGNKYYISFHCPTYSDPANILPTQIFTSGNIKEGSLLTSWLQQSSRPDRVIVEFSDANNYYLKGSAVASVSGFDDATEVQNESTYFIPGITTREHARREAILRLQLARSITRKVEFEADIDAIACEAGDVIAVQHEGDKYKFGGRIIGTSGGSTLLLDRTINLDASMFNFNTGTLTGNCIILVRSGSTIVKRYVTGPFGSDTSQVNITGSVSSGMVDAQYGIGKTDYSTWFYMIESIEITQEGTAKIEAFNYDPSAYFYSTEYGATPI